MSVPRFATEDVEGHTFVSCADCGSDAEWVDCEHCGGEGVTHHNCGEDTCCCVEPEDNVECAVCEGLGGWYACLARCDAPEAS